MARNSSDSFGLYFNPEFLPGIRRRWKLCEIRKKIGTIDVDSVTQVFHKLNWTFYVQELLFNECCESEIWFS